MLPPVGAVPAEKSADVQARIAILLGLLATASAASVTACGLGDALPAVCIDDLDCPSEVPLCHGTARICVADCLAGALCPEGESCDSESGWCACRPEDDRCPAGTACHAEDRVCVAVGCDDGCEEGRTCCASTGQCLVNAARCEVPEEGTNP